MHKKESQGDGPVKLTFCYVHNFWIKEENRIGAKPRIKRKDMDLIEEILASNGFNWGNPDL